MADKTEKTESEFEWAPMPATTRKGGTVPFDYGFDRFPAPKEVEGGETQYASRLYKQTYKAVKNALARYMSDLTEAKNKEGGEVELPEFKSSSVRDTDKKYVGTRVWRMK